MSDLALLHESITRTLKAALPDILHVEEFPEMGTDLRIPALLYGLTDVGPGPDRGTGETALIGRFQSCIMVDVTEEKASLKAAVLAAQVVVALRGQYWDMDFVLGPPEQVHAQPEAPPPDLEQFVMWSVQWIQHFELGALEWPWVDQPSGEPPSGSGGDGSVSVVLPEDAL